MQRSVNGAEPENVLLNLNVSDFTCPISQELFFWPVELSCEHIFENGALKNANCKTCPVCNEAIKEVNLPGRFFINQLDQLYAQYPELIKQIYFSTEYVAWIIQSDIAFLHDRLAAYLKLPEKFTAQVALDLMSFEEGIAFLKKHPAFLNLAKQMLNQPVATKNGLMTPLYCLVQMSAGIQLLHENTELLESITPEALNWQRDAGVAKNTSPLAILCASDQGVQLFIDHASLRSKMVSHGLNAVQLEGPETGASPVYDLVMSPLFKTLYQLMPQLLDMISSEALNALYVTNNTSALYWICEKHIELLEHARLREKISKEAFNALRTQECDINVSPLLSLAKKPAGQALLLAFPELSKLIDAKGLNAITLDPYGESTLSYLLKSLDGKKLFYKRPQLAELIDVTVLQRADMSGSLASYLQQTITGRELIAANKTLADKVTMQKRSSDPDDKSVERKGDKFPPKLFSSHAPAERRYVTPRSMKVDSKQMPQLFSAPKVEQQGKDKNKNDKNKKSENSPSKSGCLIM